MKLSRILAIALGTIPVASKRAIALTLRDSTSPVPLPPMTFNITNLAASALVLSHRVSYSFNVTTSPGSVPTHCWALATTMDEALVNVTKTACGTDTGDSSAISFQWTQFADGSANLTVNRALGPGTGSASAAIARHRVAANETAWLGKVGDNTEFMRQAYVGPANFSVPAVLYV